MPAQNFPIRRLTEDPASVLDRHRWPGVLPPVAQVLDQGPDLSPATIFVGDNGSGKSTLVDHLQLVRNAGTTRRGDFLRAETMHGFFTYLEGAAEKRIRLLEQKAEVMRRAVAYLSRDVNPK